MKIGEYVSAKTHAEFINRLLGTNYKGYGKCTLSYNNKVLWIIKLDGKKSKTGWINSISADKNEIYEFFIGNPSERMESHKIPVANQTRLVFDVIDGIRDRAYVFRGVFTYDNLSNNDKRVWKKIANEYNF